MTYAEVATYIRDVLDGNIPDGGVPWEKMDTEAKATLASLLWYEVEARLAVDQRDTQRKRMAPAQKRAIGLLLSLLTPAQRSELRRTRRVVIRGTAGGWYRIRPSVGQVTQVEWHKSRWYQVTSYCLHDPDGALPPADSSVGHLLLLLSDEPSFLAEANATDRRSLTLWNGDWLRRLRQARLARRAA